MYVATIGQIDRDKMVSVLETELDTINDRLDEFNAVTKIED
jgi:malonyl CoA-acyl carrier protein transacylase